MKKINGICMVSGLNLNKEYITESAIINSYFSNYSNKFPMYISHDKNRPIGITSIGPLVLDKEKVWLMNDGNLIENDQELLENNKYFIKKIDDKLDNKEKFDELIKALNGKGVFLTYYAQMVNDDAVCIIDNDIVLKIYPNIKAELDKDCLIDISKLEYINEGCYKYGEFILFPHQFFRRSLSQNNSLNFEFIQELNKLKTNKKLTIKIAIDFNRIGLIGTQKKILEHQYIYGPKFNNSLNEIPSGVTVHESDNFTKLMTNIEKTDFWWYTQNHIQTFECEELNECKKWKNNDYYYGCRFVHCMLGNSELPSHFDGAIRGYNSELYEGRKLINISKTKRNTDYTKLWRIDGEIEIKEWKKLLSLYYRDNVLIGEYLGGKDEILDEIKNKKESEVTESTKISSPIVALNLSNDTTEENCLDLQIDLQNVIINGTNKESIDMFNTIIQNFGEYKVDFNKLDLKITSNSNLIILPTVIFNDVNLAKRYNKFLAEYLEKEKSNMILISLGYKINSQLFRFSYVGSIKDALNILNIELPINNFSQYTELLFKGISNSLLPYLEINPIKIMLGNNIYLTET